VNEIFNLFLFGDRRLQTLGFVDQRSMKTQNLLS